MALEFPSWLEWLSWLVGSEWPHGNEDRMWQMGRDLEAVAGQSDELIDELTRLMDDIEKAYPDGVGGESTLKWLKPLRDGDDSGHGSVKEFGDNYRQLSKAADQMGDSLQATKINFYIAGGFLLAELAWAAGTGPFAGFFEAEALTAARFAFRRLGQMFENRIESMLMERITDQVLRKIVTKAIYEVGKGAFISTVQSVGQEFAVQTIQNMNGHGHGYDWNALAKNAAVSAFSGAAGGAIGFGANRALPIDMGGWRGTFNGALTGAAGGLGGAGAAWLGNGVVNGNWDLDPRALTGGAFAGAGPGGLYGHAGLTNHNGVMDVPTRDGSTHLPEPTGTRTFDQPGADGRPGSTAEPTTAPANGGTNGSAPDGSSNGYSPGSGRDGGPSLHAASAPDAVSTDHAPPAEHSSSDSPPADNQAPVGVDGRRERPEADAQNDPSTSDSGPQRGSDTHTPSADSTATGDGHTTGDSHATGDQHTATGDHGGEPGRPGDPNGHTSEPKPDADSNHAAAGPLPTTDSGSPAPAPQNGGDPGRATGPGSTAPGSGSGATPSTTHSGSPTGTAGDIRPSADPAKAAALPRDLRAGAPSDGIAPKPVGPAPDPRAAATDKPFRSGTDPVQASKTGVEAAGPRPVDSATGEHDGTGHHEPGIHEPIEEHTPSGKDRVPDNREHTPGDKDRETAPHAGLPDAGPVLVHLPAPHDGESTRTPSDNRRSGVPAAAPVGDFHGDARPEGKALDQKYVDGRIDDNLQLITPEDVAWNRDTREFVLPNGDTVRIKVAETEPPPEGGKRDVAQIHEREGGYDIHISPRARNEDVARAVAHELAEIRLSQDDDIPISRPDMREDRPDQMTPHLAGRIAELKVLAAHIDRAVMDPATKAEVLPRLRNDLHDLTRKLGFQDPAHEATVKQLLHDHDPALAKRIALEEHDILGHRPKFGPTLDEHDFEQGARDHIDQLEQHLTGEHAPDTLRAEEQGMHGRMREELSRRIFDPIFDPETRTARKTWDGLLDALNPLSDIINDPSLSPRDRPNALRQAIEEFRSHPDMTPEVRDAIGDTGFQHMHDAAKALAEGPNHITGVLDTSNGRLTIDGRETTLGEFLQGIDRANRGATENGLNVEYTVVLHDPVNGQSAVEVLPRPRPQHRLPLEQGLFGPNHEPIPREQRASVSAAVEGGHTIDVGVGRGAYAVELTPEADRSHGGLVIKTELASEMPGAAQRRRDLGILDPGPLTEPGTVMVFADLLTNGHLLGDGPGGEVARIYINNVSAHLDPSDYHGMAERLETALKPGGRVEIQWDPKPENTEGPPVYRGHITGPDLWQAIKNRYDGRPNPFRIVEETTFPGDGYRNYDYTIDTGASNNLNRERMADIVPPLPEHRMVIAYEPEGPHTGPDTHASSHENPEIPSHENAAPPHDNAAPPHDGGGRPPGPPHDGGEGPPHDGEGDPTHGSDLPEHQQRREDLRELREETRDLRQAGLDSVRDITGRHPGLDELGRPGERALVTGRYRSDHRGEPHDTFNYSGTPQEWHPASEAPAGPPREARIFDTAQASAYDPATGRLAEGAGNDRFNDAEAKFFENLVRDQLAEHSGLSPEQIEAAIRHGIERADAEVESTRPSLPAEKRHARHVIEFAVHELNERARDAAPDPSAYIPLRAKDFSPHQLARQTGLPHDVIEALYPAPKDGAIDTRHTMQRLAEHGLDADTVRQVFQDSVNLLEPDEAFNHFSKLDVLHATKRMESVLEELNALAKNHADEQGTPYTPITRDSITGDLRMVVDLPAARTQDMPLAYQICNSCQRVILAYESVFPGMRLEIVNLAGERLHPR
ncbi:hypothetical protein [Nocardia sp. NPDC051981]|uniref:WXG100-like domain-containing protein n=1 Tax=Nocardia sp. NPDC051981 TaxID=3155417 RepID=UPI00343C426B